MEPSIGKLLENVLAMNSDIASEYQ
jgi:hypothetical protein